MPQTNHAPPMPPPPQELTMKDPSTEEKPPIHSPLIETMSSLFLDQRRVKHVGRTNKDWGLYRETIISLYRDEGRTVADLKELMQTRHNFIATQKMYRFKLRSWNINKFITTTQVERMVAFQILKRKHHNGEGGGSVVVRGKERNSDVFPQIIGKRFKHNLENWMSDAQTCNLLDRKPRISNSHDLEAPQNHDMDMDEKPSNKSMGGKPRAAVRGSLANGFEIASFPNQRPGYRSWMLEEAKIWRTNIRSVMIDDAGRTEFTMLPRNMEFLVSLQSAADKKQHSLTRKQSENSSTVLSLMQDLISSVRPLMQYRTAHKRFARRLQLLEKALKQQSHSLTEILHRTLQDKGWENVPELRTLLLQQLFNLAIANFGFHHPLSVMLRFLQEEQVLAVALDLGFPYKHDFNIQSYNVPACKEFTVRQDSVPATPALSTEESMEILNVGDTKFEDFEPHSESGYGDSLLALNPPIGNGGETHATFCDDQALEPEPAFHVDYLYHEWKEEDIWSSWRYIIAKRKVIPNSVRAENALWRTWTKAKHNLKTPSLGTVNVLRSCDVTWLNGPLQNNTKKEFSTRTSPSPSPLSRSSLFIVNIPPKNVMNGVSNLKSHTDAISDGAHETTHGDFDTPGCDPDAEGLSLYDPYRQRSEPISESSTLCQSLDSEAEISDGERSFMQSPCADDVNEHNATINGLPFWMEVKKELGEGLVKDYLARIIPSPSTWRSCAGSSGSGSDRASTLQTTASTPLGLTTPSSAKHRRSGTENEDDEEDERGQRKKRLKRQGSSDNAEGDSFACPYAKRQPERYSNLNTTEVAYRGCSGGYWPDVSRLKQHLYRVHRQPEHHCARCFEIFETIDLLNKHLRQPRCPVRVSPFPEKMTRDQLKKIKRRASHSSPSVGWYAIFKILFPGADLPSSPFAGAIAAELLQSYGAFFRQEAATRLLSILRFRLGECAPLDVLQVALLQDVLEDSIAEVVQQVGRDFRPSLLTSSGNQSLPRTTQPQSDRAYNPSAGETLHTPTNAAMFADSLQLMTLLATNPVHSGGADPASLGLFNFDNTAYGLPMRLDTWPTEETLPALEPSSMFDNPAFFSAGEDLTLENQGSDGHAV